MTTTTEQSSLERVTEWIRSNSIPETETEAANATAELLGIDPTEVVTGDAPPSLQLAPNTVESQMYLQEMIGYGDNVAHPNVVREHYRRRAHVAEVSSYLAVNTFLTDLTASLQSFLPNRNVNVHSTISHLLVYDEASVEGLLEQMGPMDIWVHTYSMPSTELATGGANTRLSAINYAGEVTYASLTRRNLRKIVERARELGWAYTLMGWDVKMIHRMSNDSASYTEEGVPYLATPPEGHPLHGKHAALLADFVLQHPGWYERIMGEYDFAWVRDLEYVDHTGSREIFNLLNLARSASGSVANRIAEAQTLVDRYTTELDEIQERVSSLIRSQHSQREEVRAMLSARRRLVLNEFQAVTGLSDRLERLRPVKEARLLNNGRLALEVDFHDYVMKFAYGGSTCLDCLDDNCPGRGECDCTCHQQNVEFYNLPSAVVKLDLTATTIGAGIKVDLQPHMQGDWDHVHPHVRSPGGRICWGNAGIPIAEAWGRSDWESVVRLIVGWYTQYNHDSPYVDVGHWRDMNDGEENETRRARWLT